MGKFSWDKFMVYAAKRQYKEMKKEEKQKKKEEKKKNFVKSVKRVN